MRGTRLPPAHAGSVSAAPAPVSCSASPWLHPSSPRAGVWVLVEATASALQPLLLRPLPWPPPPRGPIGPAPPVSQAWAPADHPARPPDRPPPCAWAIDQEWLGAPRRGREGARRGTGRGEGGFATSEPSHLPSSRTAPPRAGPAWPVASDGAACGGLEKGALHSPEPGSPLQRPGVKPRPGRLRSEGQSCQETEDGAST